ncbi:MAG: ribosomal protein bL12, partial [Chloroflexota bacterium]
MAVAEKKKTEELLSQFEKMTILEISDFVKAFEDRFGVTAAAPVAAASAPTVAAETPVEEQTEFTVMLNAAGAQKINVIKAVRE